MLNCNLNHTAVTRPWPALLVPLVLLVLESPPHSSRYVVHQWSTVSKQPSLPYSNHPDLEVPLEPQRCSIGGYGNLREDLLPEQPADRLLFGMLVTGPIDGRK